jgi:PKD repeat protein
VIEEGPQVIAGYTVPSSTVYLDDGGSLQFTNISVGGLQYVWDFGTGQSSTQTNPLYTFAAPGNYNVKLTAFNGVCYNTSSNIIAVSASVGIAGINSHVSGFQAFESAGVLNLDFGSSSTNNVDIHIHNMLGQLVFSYSDLKIVNQHIALTIKHFRSGVYIVRVTDGDIYQAQKFTVK